MFKKHLLLVLCVYQLNLNSIDNPHFYRANYFWGEPRFEKPWLTTFEISLGDASTRHGRNRNNDKRNILDIFGPFNMQFLGAGVANLDPANPFDLILINLLALPQNENFGKFRFTGEFSTIELTTNFYQNLVHGFFIQVYMPFRQLKISDIRYEDLSPLSGFPNANTPEWLQFTRNFAAILDRFDISLKGVNRFGAGDLSILIGWARNYEETQILDYIDVDAKIGALFPTGKTRDINRPFDLPQGYNGHWAIPLKFDLSVGAWDWFTWGTHLGALFFFKQDKATHFRSSTAQNGLIQLARAKAQVDPGTIWEASTYFKADHFIYGWSFLAGYTFTKREHTTIESSQISTDKSIINNDGPLKPWQMHVIHLFIEYDFTKKPTGPGPRVGFFYNRVVAGERVWDANIKAGYFGLDIGWCY